MEPTKLTSQELVDRFSDITNRDTAFRAVADNVLEKLIEHYQNIELQEDIDNQLLLECIEMTYIKGYSIQQRTPLQTPEVKRGLLGLIKHTKTHDTKELCYIDNMESSLIVKVNERPVIYACEEIKERTGGKVSVKYTF